jgi:hypothetical protein
VAFFVSPSPTAFGHRRGSHGQKNFYQANFWLQIVFNLNINTPIIAIEMQLQLWDLMTAG